MSAPAVFARVILPNSLNGIAASAILVFLHALGAFGVILMVGGSVPGETRVASIAIYEAVETLQYGSAAMMSLALLPVCYDFLLDRPSTDQETIVMSLQIRIRKRLPHFDLSLDIVCPAEMMTVVIGPSGAGKTTLMRDHCRSGQARGRVHSIRR